MYKDIKIYSYFVKIVQRNDSILMKISVHINVAGKPMVTLSFTLQLSL